MPFRDYRLNGTVIRLDTSILPRLEPNLFELDWLRLNGFWQGSTSGRSRVHLFHYAGRDMVLRHFHRGGLIGRINSDLYLRVPMTRSRAMREFDLLVDMHTQRLPVPVPIAAQFVPFGPFYRADIITQRIPNAIPLAEILMRRHVSSQLRRAIGTSIRQLHDHGVYHSDLNCRNILLDTEDKIWFIDFDKCDKRAPGAWTEANLNRLRRSLMKMEHMSSNAYWRDAEWAELLKGYHNC